MVKSKLLLALLHCTNHQLGVGYGLKLIYIDRTLAKTHNSLNTWFVMIKSYSIIEYASLWLPSQNDNNIWHKTFAYISQV